MKVKAFFDPVTSTLSYIVWDEETKDALIIDAVRDYDPKASIVSDDSVKKLADFAYGHGFTVHYILDTHAHADHMSGTPLLKNHFPQAKTAIGEKINEVQSAFKTIYNLKTLVPDGSQFDKLLKDGEIIEAGSLKLQVIHTPGHTPACSSYLIGDAAFVGDALFMPDFGVARCDFPGGSAETLYDSVTKKLYALDDKIRVFTGHDYQPGGRDLAFETTIGASKKENIHLNENTLKSEFVKFRTKRDGTLAAPDLLYQSIQVNVFAGELPEKEENNKRYLKIPLNVKGQE